MRLEFVTQKPLDICILPVTGKGQRADPACGTRILLLSPVALEPSMSWLLTGVLNCRKIREQRKAFIADAL